MDSDTDMFDDPVLGSENYKFKEDVVDEFRIFTVRSESEEVPSEHSNSTTHEISPEKQRNNYLRDVVKISVADGLDCRSPRQVAGKVR